MDPQMMDPTMDQQMMDPEIIKTIHHQVNNKMV